MTDTRPVEVVEQIEGCRSAQFVLKLAEVIKGDLKRVGRRVPKSVIL